jgi:transcriptional regulator with XRE-family HTH domain
MKDVTLSGMAEAIRCLRKESGLSLVKLAAKAGVSFATVQKLEAGHHWPNLKVLIKIANVLDVHVIDIIMGKQSKSERIETVTETMIADLLKSVRSVIGNDEFKSIVERFDKW